MNFVALEGENAVLLVFWGLISNNFEVDTDVSGEHAAAFSTAQETVSQVISEVVHERPYSVM